MSPTTSDQQPPPDPDPDASRDRLIATLARVTTVDLSALSHKELVDFARFIDLCDATDYDRLVVDDLRQAMSGSDRGVANNEVSGGEATAIGKAIGEYMHERAMPEAARVEVLRQFFEQGEPS